MLIPSGQSLRWVAVAGLAGFLALGGCTTRNVTVGSSVAPPPPPPTPAEESVKPMEVAKPQPMEKAPVPPHREFLDVYFAFDKWTLSPEGKKNLEQNVETLKQNPTPQLLIEGHCDERGTHEYNLVLGQKRAEEVRRYLQALGVTNEVRTTSFGKERPVCTEENESCFWKNRRAHLVLQESK